MDENQSTCLLDSLLLSELQLPFHLCFCLILSWNVFANYRNKLLFSVLVASLVLCHFSGRMLCFLLLYTTHSQHFCCPYLHSPTCGYLLTAISCLPHTKTFTIYFYFIYISLVEFLSLQTSNHTTNQIGFTIVLLHSFLFDSPFCTINIAMQYNSLFFPCCV